MASISPPFAVSATAAVGRLPPSHGVSFSLSSHNFTRRTSLLHLGAAIYQPHMFGSRRSISSRGLETNIIETGIFENIAEASTFSELNAVEFAKNDKRRMLHVVYRVGDLNKTIKFYTECLRMKLLRQRDIPEERYANAFLGYGPEESNFTVELTSNYGVDKYDIGTGFGHFGIAVEDVAKKVDLIRAKGGKITREPGPANGQSSITASIEDPDGYTFQLLERGPTPEPFCQVMLKVGDLDRAVDFYKKAYGMDLLRKRDNPEDKYSVALMGYGPEDANTVVELTYNYGVKDYDKGSGYGQIAIGTDDVYKTAESVKLNGGKIVLDPGPLPGINTKITACLDPDGWKTVFVDNVDFLKELE